MREHGTDEYDYHGNMENQRREMMGRRKMPEDIEKAGYDEQGPQKDKPPRTVKVLVCKWSTFNVFHKGC
jgi:hypothetical protein